MSKPRGAEEETRRRDGSVATKILANRKLAQLLALASAPDFKGSVTIEIHAADGILGQIKTSIVEFSKPT